ncbi:hypothetical protein [uncultured Thiocystis sp.]|jgi:hypothetical protein|uniref:hypothetical protein n=1 Tax=uncultured Thiocystis sp. TaxID=1202134 RepID=UPI0025FE5741|nr:hypothetical protein [uncultured Thiocystis sp.]
MQSPFDRHRETVLGHDATAEWLRRLVLSLWNGDGYPIGLSRIQELDDEHFEVVIEMLTSYRLHGERDPDFMALADACRELHKAALAASERQARWGVWRRDAERATRQQGGALDSSKIMTTGSRRNSTWGCRRPMPLSWRLPWIWIWIRDRSPNILDTRLRRKA